ncbi:MAG: hypothetical protein KDJ80_03470 [Nitratireductor sp.]|nr:hypothetical protein [Nitratireductor sp.]
MNDFRARLSGMLLVGLFFGLAYLAIVLAGPKVFPEPFEITSAELTPLELGKGEFAACAQPVATPAERVTAVRTGPLNPVTLHEIDPAQFPAGRDSIIFLMTRSDDARLYLCDGAGRAVKTYLSGDAVPASRQPVAASEIAFPVLAAESGLRPVLETRQPALLTTPVKVMAADAFHIHSRQHLMTRLFLYGGILSIVGYNLILGWLVGHWTYLFNALNTFSMLLLDLYLSGVGSAYVWPEQTWLSNTVMVLSEAGPGFFGVLFVYHFLHPGDWRGFLRQPAFFIWPLLNGITLASWWLFMPYWQAALGVIAVWIVGALSMTVLLIVRARRGNDRAQILLIPIVAVILPSMMAGIAQQFAGWNLGRLGAHHAEITLIFEALLFTLTFAYLLRLTEQERDGARRERLAVAEAFQQSLLTTVDRERNRIADDLHDTAGQGLLTVANRLNRVRKMAGFSAGQRMTIGEVEKSLKALIGDIRRISHDLHPAALDHVGLRGALSELSDRLSKASDCKVSLQFEGDAKLDKPQELQVFRILQELLSNAVRHSGGSAVHALVQLASPEVVLTVSDDGSGLAPPAGNENGNPNRTARRGIGLQVVAQRAEMLGGGMRLRSTGDGAQVTVRFPIGTKGG